MSGIFFPGLAAVRRESTTSPGGAGPPFDPPVTTNLVLYLRADADVYTDTGGTTPATNNGDLVALWKDQSAAGNDVSQATSGSRPTLQLNQVNGLPSLRWAGGQALTHTEVSYGQETIYAVLTIADGSNPITICSGSVGNLQYRVYQAKCNTVAMNVANIGSGTNALSLNTWTQVNVSHQDNGGLNYTDVYRQVSAANGTATVTLPGTCNGEVLFVGAKSGGEAYSGDIGALLIYTGVHDLTTKQSIEDWITSTWGV